MTSKQSFLRIAVLAMCINPAVTMASKQAASADKASSQASPESGAVNPMTGKLLSEEQLNRALARARIQTQLDQEILKQTQTKGEIALAPVRLSLERDKISSLGSGFSGGPIPGAAGARPPALQGRPAGAVIPPMPTAQPGAPVGDPMAGRVMVEARQQVQPASGGIEFGGVRIAAASTFGGSASKVEYVDVHATGAPSKLGGGGSARPQPSSNVVPVLPAPR